MKEFEEMRKYMRVKAEEEARFKERLEQLRGRIERLREERAALDPYTYEWNWADGALFEARCEARMWRRALTMAGRRWECASCGEEYGPEWVAASGLRCHVECDGWLEEVR
jgi:hypothetical protein